MLAATRKAKVVTDDSETYARQATEALQAAMALQETLAVMATSVQQANQQYAFDHDWQVAITQIGITEVQLPVRHVLHATAMLNMAVMVDQSDLAMVASNASVTPQESEMLAKVRRLSPENRDEVIRIVDEMLDREDMRRLVREAFEISSKSFARYWGPKGNANPKKSL
ncbi:MAG TPA: hypothetical protein VMW75_10680 [Thermoanaerobaculia bacterium]|nr:hypothetical protein [Thermoanaerobaculia bacterium]